MMIREMYLSRFREEGHVITYEIADDEESKIEDGVERRRIEEEVATAIADLDLEDEQNGDDNNDEDDDLEYELVHCLLQFVGQ